jgi:hypothetical protein
MTNDSKWDPYDERVAQEEATLYNTVDIDWGNEFQGTVSSVASCLSSISSVYDSDTFMQRLHSISSTLTKKRRQLTPEDLASKWFIGI